MAPTQSNSPEALSAEILAEAKRDCDQIIHRAQQEAETLVASAMAEAEKIRREKLEAARAEAGRRSELILASVPVEAGRLRSARIESMLESIRDSARRRLLAREFDVHETVMALASEAIRRMPGADFVLKISPTDHATFATKLAGEVAQRSGRSPLNLTISPDPAMTDSGVIVAAANGTRIWDNRLLSRLERLWPELRRQLATQTSLVEKNEPAGGGA